MAAIHQIASASTLLDPKGGGALAVGVFVFHRAALTPSYRKG
jgi:hypothetical protein